MTMAHTARRSALLGGAPRPRHLPLRRKREKERAPGVAPDAGLIGSAIKNTVGAVLGERFRRGRAGALGAAGDAAQRGEAALLLKTGHQPRTLLLLHPFSSYSVFFRLLPT